MDGDAAKPLDKPHTYRPEEIIRPQANEAASSETPRSQSTPAQQPEASPIANADASQTAEPEAAPAVNTTTSQEPQPVVAQADAFIQDQTSPAFYDVLPKSISWTASEFIAHEKTANWYVLSVLSAVAAAALVWLFARDLLPTSAVFVGMLLIAYYASHKPRQQHYELNESGLTIGDRHLPYREFRSFAVIQEGAFLGIELTPLKRFAMYTTLYIDPADEDRIIEFLSAFLPMEEARVSMTDSLMRRIHF